MMIMVMAHALCIRSVLLPAGGPQIIMIMMTVTGPQTAEGRAVRVRYEHAGGGLVARGGRLGGFAVAGADRKYVWADAKLDGDEVLVRSAMVEEPEFLRYNYMDVPTYSLWNKDGLPAAPFDARIGP